MTFKRLPLLMLGSCLLLTPALNAAQLNLHWQEPDEFRDIEAGNELNQKQFQQNVIDELGKHIEAAADKYLQPDQTLNMTVTNIDLAGNVEYFFTRFPQGLRVVRNLYFPSIEFSYELVDAQGKVQMSGEENVRDIGISYSGTRLVESADLGYEKRMIDDWFSATFGGES